MAVSSLSQIGPVQRQPRQRPTPCALSRKRWLSRALATCPPDARNADEDTDDTRPKREERKEPRANGVRMRVGPQTDRGRAYDEEQRPAPKDEETEAHLHEARLQAFPH
jgi:hypothetical protein